MGVHYARSFAVVQAQTRPKLTSVIRNSGVSAVECIEVYGDMIRTFPRCVPDSCLRAKNLLISAIVFIIPSLAPS